MLANVERRTIRLTDRHTTATLDTDAREVLLVTLAGDDQSGVGEASPLRAYSPDSLEECESALENVLNNSLDLLDADDPTGSLARIDAMPAPARAALEVALRDLAARRSGLPLWRTLGTGGAAPVAVSRLITAQTVPELAAKAERAVAEGYGSLKIKVGPEGPCEWASAVRQAVGADIRITADANGTWPPDEAPTLLKGMAEADVDWIEQPVMGVAGMRTLRDGSPIPICLDEDVADPGAFEPPAAADICCIKLQSAGGIDRMIEMSGRARSAGMRVVIGSTLDGPVGIAASLHAAAVIEPDLPCGLATITDQQGIDPGEWVISGTMLPPDGPGLGRLPMGSYGRTDR